MDIDVLDKDKDSKGFSDIIRNAKRKYDDMYISTSELNSSSVRQKLKEAYISGYLEALDHYKILMAK